MSDLLAQLQAARTDEEREWLLMKFNLESLDAPVREAVWAAAIPHWFDADILAILLNRSNTEDFQQVFKKLISLSFVESFSNRGYNIHERSRKLLLNRLWEEDQAQYRELNKRAADYCARQDQNDTGWRVETIYHQVLADELGRAEVFRYQGIRWNNTFEYGKLETLIRPIIVEAEAGRVKTAAAWAYYFQAMLDDIYSNFHDSISHLEKAIDLATEDQLLKSNSIFLLGKAHFMLSEYELARQRLEEALELFKQMNDKIGQASCIIFLGDRHYHLSEHEAARQKYEEALQISRQVGNKTNEANSILSLGMLHCELKEYEAARQRLEEALELFKQIGSKMGQASCIYNLGDRHYHLNEYEAARQKYEESLQISKQIGDKLGQANCIYGLGNIHYRLDESQAARERYEEAIQLFHQIGSYDREADCTKKLNEIRRKLEGKEAE